MDGVGLTRRYHVIMWLILLQHEPHGFHVFFSITPIPLGIEVPHVKFLLQARFNSRRGASNFSADERLAPARRLMVEKNAIAGKDPIAFAVVDCHPISV